MKKFTTHVLLAIYALAVYFSFSGHYNVPGKINNFPASGSIDPPSGLSGYYDSFPVYLPSNQEEGSGNGSKAGIIITNGYAGF